ncbi:hypothetical protein [Cyanobium sp. PCC 7001]|uniref:hypothetical protein n=1 Tax=Cyanobium sp. PCC 7001 TaxID=180281 RepID=UPI0012EA7F74|nr:hypothetical protein [Cyanobium sp. PCC 7001]
MDADLQRAMDNAVLMAGKITCKRDHGWYTVLTILTDHRIAREVAYWDDSAIAASLDRYGVGDTILCEVYPYLNPKYPDWKVWDLLEFDEQTSRRLAERVFRADQSARSLRQQFDALTGEVTHIRELSNAIGHAKHIEQQANGLMAIAGASLLVAGLPLALSIGGMAVALPAAGVLCLCASRQQTQSTSATTLNQRMSEFTGRRSEIRVLANRTLNDLQQIEGLVKRGKLQPWKRPTNEDYRIFFPPALAMVETIAKNERSLRLPYHS